MAIAITLSSLGGTFISGTSYNPKARRAAKLAIPVHTEETEEEQRFIEENDYLRFGFVPIEELGADPAYAFEEEEECTALTAQLFNTMLTPAQSLKAAEVIIDNPELLIELYLGRLNLDDDLSYQPLEAAPSKKGIMLVREIFKALLTILAPKEISRSFACHRDPASNKTILAMFALMAQKELRQECPCGAALAIMRTLGHHDVFASYLG